MLELIINKEENKKNIMLVENGILIERHEENEEQLRLEGNIYAGIVQNVLPGMQSAFIDIGENKNTFIKLKDVLPKYDETLEENKNINDINIKDLIKPGQKILVQIRRDGALKKGAKVSTHINLSGRFLVLMPNTNFVTISQKIEDTEEIARLKHIISNFLPKEYGVIIRTSCQGIEEEMIRNDFDELIDKWKEISKKYNETFTSKTPKLLYDNQALVRRTVIDILDKDLNKIIVNGREDFNTVQNILKEYNIESKIEVEMHESNKVLVKYDLQKQIDRIKERKVWLKCGGFITIDKTEALTAIDVNSAKYTGNRNVHETIFKVNKEATIEIAKQLKLRDIGGIIIIDYIDMDETREKEIIEILLENLKKDRTKTQVMGFTNLNLLEMTRKKLCNNDEY